MVVPLFLEHVLQSELHLSRVGDRQNNAQLIQIMMARFAPQLEYAAPARKNEQSYE
jgi:hypothetical protein